MCPSPVCIIQWIVFVPTLAVGLPLNLAALYLLIFRIRRWTESTVYLSSLIFNDSLLIFSLPFKMYAYKNSWDLSPTFCSFLESLVFVNIYGSILFIVCISGDRYVSLQFPFNNKRLRSPRNASLVCLCVWVTIFLFTVPVYNLHTQNSNGTLHGSSCFQNFSKETWKKKWIIVTMESTFLISTVSMVFFSVGVMRILKNLRQRNPLDEKLRHNKSVKIVLCNLVAFLLCFIPYHVAAFAYFMAKNYQDNENNEVIIDHLRTFVHISNTISSVNCLTDGVCYYFILKEGLLNAQQEIRSISIRNKINMLSVPRGTSSDRYPGV